MSGRSRLVSLALTALVAALVSLAAGTARPAIQDYQAIVVNGVSATSPLPELADHEIVRSDNASQAMRLVIEQGYEIVDIEALSGDRLLILTRR